MKKAKKAIVLIASIIIVMGITFVGVIIARDLNLETKTYDVTEEFSSVYVDVGDASVNILPSESAECKVTCVSKKGFNYSISVKDGMLLIEEDSSMSWHEKIQMISKQEVSIYLPQDDYNKIVVKGNSGDVNVKNVTLDKIDIDITAGDVRVSGVTCNDDLKIDITTGETRVTNSTCKNLYAKGDTGDFTMANVIATEKFKIVLDTGDVEFTGCDATEIYISTDTGDIEGGLLSDKIFIVRTNTGDIEVPRTTSGGVCEITTDTGDVKIIIEK